MQKMVVVRVMMRETKLEATQTAGWPGLRLQLLISLAPEAVSFVLSRQHSLLCHHTAVT